MNSLESGTIRRPKTLPIQSTAGKSASTIANTGWCRRSTTFFLVGVFMALWIVILLYAVPSSSAPPPLRPKPHLDVDPWEEPLLLHMKGGDEDSIAKRNAIRDIFMHGWNAYKRHAWGSDELRTTNLRGHNWLGKGLAATLVDSLSTMYVMGLKEEFLAARQWVEQEMSKRIAEAGPVSFFECTIRILGGLLSAYDLTGDSLFLDKAKEVGDRLLPAFSTSSGYPLSTIDLTTGVGEIATWTAGVILAEIGTVQMEFVTLSKHLRDPKYARAALRVYDTLEKQHRPNGLYYLILSPDSGAFTSEKVSLGALGDSFYEYLLKMFVLTNHHGTRYKRLYEAVSEVILNKLLQREGNYTYIAELEGDYLMAKFDHLACFSGGMFALGAMQLKKESNLNLLRHQHAAAEITETCHRMYAESRTKLSPESVTFSDKQMHASTRYYILRPEAVESFFYLYRTTADSKYRDYGWEVLTAINRTCRVSNGFSGVRDVQRKPPELDDSMQSFFLAETLKYIYLLFSPPDFINLNEYVFNTEAHPLKVYKEDFNEWKYLIQ